MFPLTGVAKYLFVPLAEAVVFALLASYPLSRTLVPTMAKYLLRGQPPESSGPDASSRNLFVRLQPGFERGFKRLLERYHQLLELCLHYRRILLLWFYATFSISLAVIMPCL